MSDGNDRDAAWITVAPGLKVEVEYELVEYRISEDGELPGKLTGRVRVTKDAIQDAQWGGPVDTGSEG